MQMDNCIPIRTSQQPEKQAPYDRGMCKLMTFQASDLHAILHASARSRANARGDDLDLLTGQRQLCHQVLNDNLLATKMRRIICSDMNNARSLHSISTHSSFAWQ